MGSFLSFIRLSLSFCVGDMCVGVHQRSAYLPEKKKRMERKTTCSQPFLSLSLSSEEGRRTSWGCGTKGKSCIIELRGVVCLCYLKRKKSFFLPLSFNPLSLCVSLITKIKGNNERRKKKKKPTNVCHTHTHLLTHTCIFKKKQQLTSKQANKQKAN